MKLLRVFTLSALAFLGSVLISAPVLAQSQLDQSSNKTPDTMSGSKDMSGMGMMNMGSSIDLADPMSQEASGTAWLPASSPMYAKMFMEHGNMIMVHGAIMPRYTNVGSKRGDNRFDAPNWFMAMFSHPLDSKSQLGLRLMNSLDPVTEGGYGYPLLFQTGETWHGQPLHDRQHPHDLFDEVSATYSRRLGGDMSGYLYLADPGEPALGPPTYMHRLLAYDYPDAPIGHHWQDATHVTFGVATAGLNFGSKVKLEGSDFTGREPNENRTNFDTPRWDSYSGRLSYNPDANNALQISYGYINDPEGDGVNQHRITASWLYDKPLGEDANFTTALVWGQNNLTTEGKSNSFLAEADYQKGRNTFFTRLENIQKSGHELALPSPYDTGHKYDLGAYTVGYVRDLKHGQGIDTGLGIAVTVNSKPSSLNAFYGSGTPTSFEIYLRIRPSRLKMSGMAMKDTSMDQMPGMKMGTGDTMTMAAAPAAPSSPTPAPVTPPTPTPSTPAPPTPAAPPAPTAKTPVLTLAASLVRSPAKVGGNNMIVTVTDQDGKPIIGAKVTASVAMVTMDMGTAHPAFKDTGDGTYSGKVVFSMGGSWRVSIEAIASDKTTVTKVFDFTAK